MEFRGDLSCGTQISGSRLDHTGSVVTLVVVRVAQGDGFLHHLLYRFYLLNRQRLLHWSRNVEQQPPSPDEARISEDDDPCVNDAGDNEKQEQKYVQEELPVGTSLERHRQWRYEHS